MPQMLLPLELSLRLKIAILERDLAQVQARLLQLTAEHQHVTTVGTLLAEAGITLPVPLSACTFDDAQGCLRYDGPEQPAGTDGDGASA